LEWSWRCAKLPFLMASWALKLPPGQASRKAASELHVRTPAACHAMVRSWSQRSACPLFRAQATAALTRAGASSGRLTQIFDSLQTARAVTAMAGSRVLTIGVGPTLATVWLHSALADSEERRDRVPSPRAAPPCAYRRLRTCGIRWDRRLALVHRGDTFSADCNAGLWSGAGEAAEDAITTCSVPLMRVAHAPIMASMCFKSMGVTNSARGPGVRILRPACRPR